MTKDIAPCPFCGAEGYIQNDAGRFYAACQSIDCGGCYGEGWIYEEPAHQFLNEADAITAWNTRTPDPQLIEIIRGLIGALGPIAERLHDPLGIAPCVLEKHEIEAARSTLTTSTAAMKGLGYAE